MIHGGLLARSPSPRRAFSGRAPSPQPSPRRGEAASRGAARRTGRARTSPRGGEVDREAGG
ncbi:MAG: hypothetical protein B7Y12_14280 [Rhizobiales bacterium 24-66-13]|nr:MAG: hypothetical protein B7Y12_14280 [Rhizobiales bacterium 24-66-13]